MVDFSNPDAAAPGTDLPTEEYLPTDTVRRSGYAERSKPVEVNLGSIGSAFDLLDG